MATVRGITFAIIGNILNKIELVEVTHLRWEVAFYKQHADTYECNFRHLDSYCTEDNARKAFGLYSKSIENLCIAEFGNKDKIIKILQNVSVSNTDFFDVLEGKPLPLSSDGYQYRWSQVGLTSQEIIRYLANAAQR